MKYRHLFGLTLLLAIGALAAGCASIKSAETVAETKSVVGDVKGSNVGQIAPDFTLPTADGKEITKASLKGNAAVLVFWSYYCPSCEEEAPHINKLSEEFKEQGVEVIGINIGESEARIRGGIKDFGIKYTVAKDDGRKVTQEYGVIGTPTVIFLDKEGKVAYKGNELPKDYKERLGKIV